MEEQSQTERPLWLRAMDGFIKAQSWHVYGYVPGNSSLRAHVYLVNECTMYLEDGRRHDAQIDVNSNNNSSVFLRRWKCARGPFGEMLTQLPVVGERFTVKKGMVFYTLADGSQVAFKDRFTTDLHGSAATGDVDLTDGAFNKRAVTAKIKAYVAAARRAYLVNPPTFPALLDWFGWYSRTSAADVWAEVTTKQRYAACWWSDFSVYPSHCRDSLSLITRLAPERPAARVEYFTDEVLGTLGDALRALLTDRLEHGGFSV